MIIALHMAMDSSQQTKIDDSPRFLTFNQTSFHLGHSKRRRIHAKTRLLKNRTLNAPLSFIGSFHGSKTPPTNNDASQGWCPLTTWQKH